jgi:hypothetical protein
MFLFSPARHLSRIAIGKANGRHKKKILDNAVLYQIRDNLHIKLDTSGRLSFIGLAIDPNPGKEVHNES